MSIAVATYKKNTDDFIVEEIREPQIVEGGPHTHFYLEKRLQNTETIATRLSQITGVKRREIGYAGRKDKQALTYQWFSMPTHAFNEFESRLKSDEAFKVLSHHTSQKKLQVGSLQRNRFTIRLVDVKGDFEAISKALEALKTTGVLNRFGPQRFGRDGENVLAIADLMAAAESSPKAREWGISRARSLVFNQLLQFRETLCQTSPLLEGETLFFPFDEALKPVRVDASNLDECIERMKTCHGEVRLPLWGAGALEHLASNLQAVFNEAWYQPNLSFIQTLETLQTEFTWRPVHLSVKDLAYEWESKDTLCLSFELPKGAYATTVLASIFEITPYDKNSN